MKLRIQDLTPEEAESKAILDSIKIRAGYGALVFSTLLELEWGQVIIEDTLLRYESDNIIERFNLLFDSLSQKVDVLNYSEEEWLSFYYELIQDVDLAEYVDLFTRWLFARSFAAEMYSYLAPAFQSLSKEEYDKYCSLQTKCSPIPFEWLLVAKQIIDMLLVIDSQFWDSTSLALYYKRKN